MWFNSFDFAVFFVVVLALYYLLPFRWQNRMLLVASYVFYGWWDWRFLSLILISTIVDFVAGIRIHGAGDAADPATARRRRGWLVASVCTNLGILGFFKYFDFFAGSLAGALGALGIESSVLRLDLVLPVGISFYTFQTMSYTIDIYRGKMEPTRHFPDFALFVAFFPQLVAGPIERARVLVPQILRPRTFSAHRFADGAHLIFWGLFKKVFVADNLARTADAVFADPNASWWSIVVGVYAFAFQIYCDFSGYSDIARGCAKCLGFELMLNFDFPYIAVSPSDFWRRWHISLSSWLRDYLYIPLGGNRGGRAKTYRNLSLTMLLGGLWHGAAWNFVAWGAYHGLLLVGQRLLGGLARIVSGRAARGRAEPGAAGAGAAGNVAVATGAATEARSIDARPAHRWGVAAGGRFAARALRVALFFQLTCLGWLFFRVRSLGQAGSMLRRLVTLEGTARWGEMLVVVEYALPLLAVETVMVLARRDDVFRLAAPLPVKAAVYGVLFYLFAFLGAQAQSFIYFQF
ncbi:MAG: MBOAT family protein [Candidatus Krumholzibacteriota bacterium]|nr:MBOAT family protein [Candidatus Krumholzibacteriota bacterium]